MSTRFQKSKDKKILKTLIDKRKKTYAQDKKTRATTVIKGQWSNTFQI